MTNLLLWQNDPWLEPFKQVIFRRHEQALIRKQELMYGHKRLSDAVNGHLYYGLHLTAEGWVFREWAPDAAAIYIVGECNNWEKSPDYALQAIGNGNWEIHLPTETFHHLSFYKLLIEWEGGSGLRIPAYATRVVQNETTKLFSAQVWNPKKKYIWKNASPLKVKNPLIYEAHIGMSGEEERVATYTEFRKNVLPRIVDLGYNMIQLMAIQEHPYYGSFGYQVSNFFAASSRFGTPDELKQLIDEAHSYGIAVILDIVHSHAVRNEEEGLSRFDGTYNQYFHDGERGEHRLWNSRCFNYGRSEVLHFLLSNCKYWTEEYRFDGFRFDGVTSMIYFDHGLGRSFTDYSMYFDGGQDEDALTYLSLANTLIHEINPQAVSIAEEVSGMPGLAAPLAVGGAGFDFRMSMGVADYWIKIIKEQKDEEWNVGELFHELTNKRADERTISYAECHDQAMVGDKTIIFRLMDKEMYADMSVLRPNLIVERGMALHKMIRLLSLSTSGDGYLNFMGNEFGHPEWIDFPREGNNWSYQYARRQWHLLDDKTLRYQYLWAFDKAMIALAQREQFLAQRPQLLLQHIVDQVLAFKRGDLLFVFNFHPEKSYTDYRVETAPGKYLTALDSDAVSFNGLARLDSDVAHFTINEKEKNYLQLYLPNRTAQVLKYYP
ncbi:MAG: alpha amylase C-terminal domain-containing protein [Bacteroidales bacterium]|nr:alpha amylase C-terminal domain-containing protein [Bacteroidales bacterium]